jgi:hypothetical protein
MLHLPVSWHEVISRSYLVLTRHLFFAVNFQKQKSFFAPVKSELGEYFAQNNVSGFSTRSDTFSYFSFHLVPSELNQSVSFLW